GRMVLHTENKIKSSSLGFTLPEALVAVFAATIMIAALFATFTYGMGAVKLAREDLRATQILLQQMEKVRLTSFTEIQDITSTERFDPSDEASGGGGTVYSISIKATMPTAADMVQPVYYTNKMLKIVGTATWTNGSILRSRTLRTYASANG